MFKEFRDVVEAQFNKIAKGDLYIVNREKDDVWERYLDAFPEGTNEVRTERREYDCNACKTFLRRIGNVVGVKNGKIITVWDVKVEGYYQVVADNLAAYVKDVEIKDIFLHDELKVGAAVTNQLLENETTVQWNHFSCELPSKFVTQDVAADKGAKRSRRDVFKRGLEELSLDSCEVVEDLVLQNSLYRGEEHIGIVKKFIALKKKYDKLKKEKFNPMVIFANDTHDNPPCDKKDL